MKLPPLLSALLCTAAAAQDFSFFESKIRPVLASSCYDCHGSEKQQGGLRLDWRDGLLKGGKSGPAIVPGHPEQSTLLHAIAHTSATLKMPKNGDPLSAATVDAFREWILQGAPDPRTTLPARDAAADWPAAFALRRQAWCWQPLRHTGPPVIPGVENPVDGFLQDAIRKAGLVPAPPASPAAQVRRAALILTGLPPEPEEVAAFTRDPSPAAWDALLDRLLASPGFGERWARHWMDWVRYAESHGSEGDPAIPHAWRYRDYLIRSLNADIPYPALVAEHIAGDLLPPRLSPEGDINEAALGPAHLRMVFHGFTPTDALDERVTFTDNQVDVVSKAFLGLTVSCARCHNHKFDAISQADYYALYGIFANTRPATIDVSPPDREAATRSRLQSLHEKITHAIRQDWTASLAGFEKRLEAWVPAGEDLRKEAIASGHGPLAAWLAMKQAAEPAFAGAWTAASRPAQDWIAQQKAWTASLTVGTPGRWDGRKGSLTWTASGHGVSPAGAQPGFQISPEGDRVITAVLPPGFTSSRYSAKDRGVVTSSPFQVDGGKLWIRASGTGSGVRYAVQNYPRSGLIYPKAALNSPLPGWIQWDLDYWKGESIHIEAWTGPDAPVETAAGDRFSFSLTEVAWQRDPGQTPPEPGVPLQWFAPEPPANRAALAALYSRTVRSLLEAPEATTAGSEFLQTLMRCGLLPDTLAALPAAAPLIREYRTLEQSLHEPVRAPGVLEGGSGDQPLYVRGNHKKPGAAVPRRFLEAIDPAPYHPGGSGRRELAASLTSPQNPLASRVIVNRLWHHVFGRGIVATPDNFGKLGEPPTHPELLDWLALRFQTGGGSIKQLLKLLLSSQAFRSQAAPSAEALARDPENKLLSHWSLRRMEAEAIRDSILKVSGQLNPAAGGPPVDGTAPRRSVYVKVIRNDPDPFLTAFDSPVPSSTRGRRDITSVPAQALTLMNAPLVQTWAGAWAARTAALEPAARIRQMYLEAFQRAPSSEELRQCQAYLAGVAGQIEQERTGRALLTGRLRAAEAEVQALTGPVRDRLARAAGHSPPDPATLAQPLCEWEFTASPGDSGGRLPLTLHNGARIEDGALVLDGTGYASSPPLPLNLREKTLEAWVSLETLDQGGGGILSVQDLAGMEFDALVFAERDPRQWVAGSNFFVRTSGFNGPQENEARTTPVHIAITWAADGTIAAFRNGIPYGAPGKPGSPVTFAAGKSQFLLGCRHGQPEGNRLLRGRIHRARVYDRALSAAELTATGRLGGIAISQNDLLAALTPGERQRCDAALAAAEQAKALLTESNQPAGDPWQSLALALLNMKEFIYLR